jgi:hypothetical protein
MQIAALIFVSMSELALVMPDITYDWVDNNPEEFNKILHDLGMNVNQPIDMQETIQHRNRFDKIVTCSRWVGNERTDKDWVNSGYASQAAIDKSKDNKLLNDLYRLRGAVE